MKSKRLVIGLSIFSAVLLIAVISLVSVLAAFQAQATGGFNISYNAINVYARVWASYTDDLTEGFTEISYTNAAGSKSGFIQFDGTNDKTESVTKSFDTVTSEQIQLGYSTQTIDGVTTRVKKPIFINYHIWNGDNANGVNLVGVVDVIPDNLTIEYIFTQNSSPLDNSTLQSDTGWTKLNSQSDIINTNGIPASGTRYIYIRMYPTNLNLSVTSTTINFSFTLSLTT